MIAPGIGQGLHQALGKDVTSWARSWLHRVASETESPALHLLRALYDAMDGLPQEWRILLEELDAATTDAIVFAVARGWVVVQAGHSICLTDVGRRLVESR